MELHVVVDELPSGEIGGVVPVVLPVTGVRMLPNGTAADGVVPAVPLTVDKEVTATVGVAGVICPDGGAQVTTVPDVVGLRASGTGASVVSGTFGWVTAENGLRPLSGEDTIVPGVDGRPIAVVPMVETCARQVWAPNSSAAIVSTKRCIAFLRA